jgi:hypothetical protein
MPEETSRPPLARAQPHTLAANRGCAARACRPATQRGGCTAACGPMEASVRANWQSKLERRERRRGGVASTGYAAPVKEVREAAVPLHACRHGICGAGGGRPVSRAPALRSGAGAGEREADWGAYADEDPPCRSDMVWQGPVGPGPKTGRAGPERTRWNEWTSLIKGGGERLERVMRLQRVMRLRVV